MVSNMITPSGNSELQTRTLLIMDPSSPRPKTVTSTETSPQSTTSPLSPGAGNMNFINDRTPLRGTETSYQGNPIREHTLRMYHIYDDQHHVAGLYY
jgi:hypothetical protein